VFGKGLLKGMAITGRRMVGPTKCDMYPYQKRELPKKSRIFLTMKATPDGKPLCQACMTCVNTCPDHVIALERDPEDRKCAVSFVVDSGRCTFCGMCEEACPFDALTFTQDFERATYDRGVLTYALIDEGTATAACVTVEPESEPEAPAEAPAEGGEDAG
jgi:NADH-quinone oxidoreductase subunit I